MPRRKQGHSKESATGGYLKKTTETGIVLIQNESFKHLPTSNDLVFKIKKTVPSSIIPINYAQEHIQFSKSLNDDKNIVSQNEVNNNNVIKHTQDEIQTTAIETETPSNVLFQGNKVKSEQNQQDETTSGHSITDSLPLVSFQTERQNLLQPVSVAPQKSVIKTNKNASPIKVITSNISYSVATALVNNNRIDFAEHVRKTDTEKQNGAMSGVVPTAASSERSRQTTDNSQTNYRISASENRYNPLKDSTNPVLEKNCQLPSSVYGTPASSVEKVLSGLPAPENNQNKNLYSAGKISFLQEILENKALKVSTNDTLQIFTDSFETGKASSESGLLQTESLLNKKLIEAEKTFHSKLKIHIPEGLNNEDSDSSMLSNDSLRTLKCPKITSPQILEQHITKIISENAAIVETLDPVWSRRYFKQTSQNSIFNNEGESKKASAKLTRGSEDKTILSNTFDAFNKSKLQTALLGGSEEFINNVSSAKERNFSQFGNTATVPASSVYSKILCNVSEEELKGSAIKSLLSLRQGKYSNHKKAFYFDNDIYNQHPQNPEGSIIKDLLLKSKTQEDAKTESEIEDRTSVFSSLVIRDLNNHLEKKTSLFKCSQCSSEFLNKYNLDVHHTFCNATNPSLPLRDFTDKFRYKDLSAQSKPLSSLDFQHMVKDRKREDCRKESNTENPTDGIGRILKQQLLMPRSPPTKRRKVSDSMLTMPYMVEQSSNSMGCDKNVKYQSESVDGSELSPYRGRSQSVHLFGGEVQILDGSKTKKIKIKTPFSGAFTMVGNKGSNDTRSKLCDSMEIGKDSSNLPGVIVTIAQSVHNSGGTVHLPSRRNTSPVVAVSPIQDGILKFSKLESPVFSFTKNGYRCEVLKSPKECTAQNLSYPCDFLPGPNSFAMSKHTNTTFKKDDFKTGSQVNELSPASFTVTLSPGNKPFYSPIFSASEKSFESVLAKTKESTISSHHVVPTVLFTPSSPPPSSIENENPIPTPTSISEPTKKFLAPTRPTTLPLKKKPFTMVSSTLVSPETPRPKKSCVQMYLNGHAYTYLGLKCSTRSTYCSIYRPQPMFVPQETNSKLSMYSNWQVVPAKEELSGLTPGQKMALYCSKKQKESKTITVNSKLGEPLTFTHSSYWTYRSQDHSDQSKISAPHSETKAEQLKESPVPSECFQDISGDNSCSESITTSVANIPDQPINSADDSSLHVDTENTCSDGELINSNDDEDDDDDCQDDGTESLTDSSAPHPPKRVKIFEGGFKSNEDYTYVRGRGRGKYVCEECGIRCKKPSMLKKHIRTHTDLRPYKCRHCSFAFKTKGNLTKHMKSKAHHKKCTELGIIPVPTTTDDSQVDEEALARQIEKKKTLFSDGEDADDDEDEESDDSEDECESDESSMISTNQQSRMLSNGVSRNSDSQEKMNSDSVDDSVKANDPVSQQTLEQEAVRSLLNLSSFGESSQWSISTGNLTDATSGETEDSSLTARTDQSLLSPSPFMSHNRTVLCSSKSKTVHDQWLSAETFGHRPRSYSADVPQTSGKDCLAKYKYLRNLNAEKTAPTSVDESSEFGEREYTRRYSISVPREAIKPHVPEFPRLSHSDANAHKWLDGETDQPMDLSITRDLGKYRAMHLPGLPSPLVSQDNNGSNPSLSSNLDSFSEPYQLKSLPVLSPQVIVDYEASCDAGHDEAPMLPLSDETAAFTAGTQAQRSLYYRQDMPASEAQDVEVSEDPASPDIADYAVCSPVSPPMLEDSSCYFTQENSSQVSAGADETTATSRFIVPNSSSSGMEEGKCICRICNKMFAKSSHLRLHVNIHYFERPFRCDNCAVSFRTKGHLQKHKRSVSHYNKVNMNLTFGTPSVDNPRPFKCGDCKIAFRIHGHLAKHLRSKMHIMKLECLGKLPFGMYAEMERSGVSLNEIDTTDCNNSLESLQVMAQKLYQRDPRRMRWQGPEQISSTGCVIPATSVDTSLVDLPSSDTLTSSFDTIDMPVASSAVQPSDSEEVKQELSESDALRMATAFNDSDLTLPRYIMSQSSTTVSDGDTLQARVEAPPESDATVSLHRSGTCHICGRLFKSAKFLQVHLYCDHPTWNASPSATEVPSSNISISSAAQELMCNLCGRQFPNQNALQQHLLSHAQPRPFVCEMCDAGFTSSASLVAHKATHQNGSSPLDSENKAVESK